MSKGSNRRPQKVDDKQLAENWERIFGKDTADRKAREAANELYAEIHANLHKIKQVTH